MANEAEDDEVVTIEKLEWRGTVRCVTDDLVREEPLELRIGGVPIAVVMRTPGHDEDLARGFLLTEAIVHAPGELVSVRHCTQTESADNVMQVVLHPSVEVDLARLRRNLYASSSCGLCGKVSIDQVMLDVAPLPPGPKVAVSLLSQLPDRLRAAQEVFERTGGLHAAGLYDARGDKIVVCEDIGRHNAVDKAIGHASRSGWPPPPILVISGRVSFEITQKAAIAGVAIIVAVSAPSSLAVQLAHRANITLAGFVREGRLSVYSAAERIDFDA